MRKTKIVCTIGPATDDENTMRELMLAGMNVARFNFSHGDYDTHEKRFRVIECEIFRFGFQMFNQFFFLSHALHLRSDNSISQVKTLCNYF